jgi:hypothetical protein
MARIWSGFMAQNFTAKEQWDLMEADRIEIADPMEYLRSQDPQDKSELPEDDDFFVIRVHRRE